MRFCLEPVTVALLRYGIFRYRVRPSIRTTRPSPSTEMPPSAQQKLDFFIPADQRRQNCRLVLRFKAAFRLRPVP